MSWLARAASWCLVLAAPLAAGAAPDATWEGYTRAGLEARDAGRYIAAEPMLRAALRLAETGGGRGRHLGTSLTNLADLYVVLHRYADAEVLLRRAVAVEEARVGPGHPAVAAVLGLRGSRGGSPAPGPRSWSGTRKRVGKRPGTASPRTGP